jgi:hypothetical protein
MSEEQKSQKQADDQVEDLEVGKEEAQHVKGGSKKKKPAGDQQQYLEVKLEDVQISSY